MWGQPHPPETKENPISSMFTKRSNKIAPQIPQIRPMALPRTFTDDHFDKLGPATSSPRKSGEQSSGSKTGSPAKTARIKMFEVEGDTPYAMDMDSNFGHGTQNAIDSLKDEIDDEMASLDKKLEGVVRTSKPGRTLGIKERQAAAFMVKKTKRKIKGSLHKMRLVRSGLADDGTSFLHSSSDEDEDALMTGLADHSEDLNGGSNGPQLVASIDPNVKKQLVVALKMKRTYKSALQGVSDQYRKSLQEVDKMHIELAKGNRLLCLLLAS